MPTTTLRTFPARVTLPDGKVVDPAAVFVDQTGEHRRVRIFALRTDAPYGDEILPNRRGAVVLVYDGTGEPEGTVRRGVAYRTAWGVVEVARGQGCGCSHPLKRFRPPEEG